MKQFSGYEYVRTYKPGEKFPSNPDFTHIFANGWQRPESITVARAGLNATTHVYRKNDLDSPA
jgi:hypothetical protein